MDIAALEDELVAVLRATITDVVVIIVPLPENTADFKRPPVGGARITVGFNESNFKDTLSTVPILQPDEMVLVISMQSRTLRDTYGIYTLKTQVEQALIGYTPANCDMPITGMYFGPPGPGMDVLDLDGWSFVYHIKTRTALVQTIDIKDAPYIPGPPGYQPPLLSINGNP